MKNFQNKALKGVLSLAVLGAIALVVALSTTSAKSSSAPEQTAQSSVIVTSLDEISDMQIVRAYYDDVAAIETAAEYFDMLETEWNKDEKFILVDTTFATRDILQKAGFTLIVDDAMTQRLQSETQFAQSRAAEALQTIPGYACYRTVEGTFTSASSLASTYPDLAEWIDIGDTWRKANNQGGYDMQVLRITNETNGLTNKPPVFIMSSIHAREYMPAEINTRFAERLLSSYGVDPDITWMVDNHEIHLLLQANPDGRKIAETGLLYRKNGNADACGGDSYYTNSSTHGGIDLNRNYDFLWGACNNESCSSSNACSATYRGTSAASEPEMQAIQAYLNTIFPDQRADNLNSPAPDDAMGIFLDYHSYGDLVLYPWGHSGNTPNNTQYETLSRKLASFSGYFPQRGDDLYATDGVSIDYAYGKLGVASLTIETGSQFFQDCPTFENSVLDINHDMMLYSIKASRAPYQLPSGPEVESVDLSTMVTLPGVPVNLTAFMDDGNFNNANGTEPTQTIAAAEYYIDTPPWEAGAVGMPMMSADGFFNETTESATAIIDTSGLSNGQHMIFVRAQDSAGNWGVVTAQWLEIDPNAPTATIVFSDDFESNQGWVSNPNGNDTGTTGTWERGNPQGTTNGSIVQQVENAASGSNALITQLAAGSSLGSFDIDNGVVSIASPSISLPSGVDSIEMSLNYYLAHLNNATTADFFRISIDGTVIFQELGEGNNDAGAWEPATIDLTAYAGQNITLLIEAADGGGGSLVEAGVDDVEITAYSSGVIPIPTATPIPPTATPLPPTPTSIPPTATSIPPTATPIPPTATSVPPTATSVPPTATSVPPTATPVPPTATPIPPTPIPDAGPVCNTYSSNDIPRALPNGTASVSSTLNVSGSGAITDLDFFANMDHEWVGDITMTLAHNGVSVTVFDRPGQPSSTWGCNRDDIAVQLDDETSGGFVESQCAGSIPTINGVFKPNNPLSNFDGVNANGTWTLTLSDAYVGADDGILNSWSMQVCTSGQNPAEGRAPLVEPSDDIPEDMSEPREELPPTAIQLKGQETIAQHNVVLVGLLLIAALSVTMSVLKRAR